MTEVLLLAKATEYGRKATEIARVAFGENLRVAAGAGGDPFPQAAAGATPPIVLSFLSPWIIPQNVLEAAKVALNWHPASAEYPGTGCYNFALYDGVSEYGAICHFMEAKVDTGRIVEERRFPLLERDTVESLKLRTLVTMLAMFHDTVVRMAGGWTPEPCGLAWKRRPYTRRELNALCRIDADMDEAEVRRRIRATVYPGYPGPELAIHGARFVYPVPDRPPLA